MEDCEIVETSMGELLDQLKTNLLVAGGLHEKERPKFSSQDIELEILRRVAQQDCAFESLLRAVVTFQATRNKHDGEHTFPPEGGMCGLCEKAYIEAEAELATVVQEATHSLGNGSPIGNPNVPAIVAAAETFHNQADGWAMEMWEELAFENDMQQWIVKVRESLKGFAERECAWRNAGDVINTLRALAIDIRNVAPEEAKTIAKLLKPRGRGYNEFVNFLRPL